MILRNVATIIVRKGNLKFIFIVVVWIFFFNKYMIQNFVFFVYNVIMLSIDERNVFEKAAQLSVIVYDNKLNNSNDEAFSINTVCNCRS